MLQIEHVKLTLDEPESTLRQKAAAALRVPVGEITACRPLRRAIDAREGVCFVYTLRVAVKNESRVLARCRNRQVSAVGEEVYRLPEPVPAPRVRPVVVGAGPAGLFCALALARCGAAPVLLDLIACKRKYAAAYCA